MSSKTLDNVRSRRVKRISGGSSSLFQRMILLGGVLVLLLGVGLSSKIGFWCAIPGAIGAVLIYLGLQSNPLRRPEPAGDDEPALVPAHSGEVADEGEIRTAPRNGNAAAPQEVEQAEAHEILPGGERGETGPAEEETLEERVANLEQLVEMLCARVCKMEEAMVIHPELESKPEGQVDLQDLFTRQGTSA
ncbi:MAG TPA: hypothetical protein VLS90_11410 [Thermodesulfobacteriota bacterium]|nr:hypothetical protein [Thermodesulfobacteriota bacterium]